MKSIKICTLAPFVQPFSSCVRYQRPIAELRSFVDSRKPLPPRLFVTSINTSDSRAYLS